jgi:hypothetical protein
MHKWNGETPLRPIVNRLLSEWARDHAYALLKFQGTLLFHGAPALSREEMAVTCELAADRIIKQRRFDETYRAEFVRRAREEAWLVNVTA